MLFQSSDTFHKEFLFRVRFPYLLVFRRFLVSFVIILIANIGFSNKLKESSVYPFGDTCAISVIPWHFCPTSRYEQKIAVLLILFVWQPVCFVTRTRWCKFGYRFDRLTSTSSMNANLSGYMHVIFYREPYDCLYRTVEYSPIVEVV
jgi:uncharacterized membrane protein